MKGESGLSELPSGWVWTQIGEICLDPQYGWTTSADSNGTLKLLRTTDITSGQIDWPLVPFCKEKPPNEEKYLLSDGDIVISRAGSVGYSSLIKNPPECVFASYLIRFRPLVNGNYLSYFLKSPSYWESISEKSLGIAIPNVNASKLKQITVPLPPLPEQHRIVTKIEELFTRLDAGVEALKKIQLQLKRYRQSVLKSAFSGELTAEWHRAHKGELEPVSKLLEKIRAERKKSSKYRELPQLDTSDLPELPEGWVWTTIQALAESNKHAIKAGPFGSSLKKEFYTPNGYKIYGQEQVIRGDSSYGDYYIDAERFEKLKSCAVKPGDVLISLVGTIGKVLVLPETIEPGIINPRLLKVSLDNNLSSNIYIKAYIESSASRQFFSLASHGGTMDILNLSILKTLPIPLPSNSEQKTIVEEIDRCFSIAEEIEHTIESSLRQSERLRQSILKRAFEGKLAPQNPDDEPAEKLLERIKAEKAKTKIYSKKGGLQ